jgi:hypothetical protein
VDSTTGNPTAIASVEKSLEEESTAQKETNSLLVYLSVFVGVMVLLLLGLVLILSQQQRRSRRRKRRRKSDDLPLKQRMAVSPQHLAKEPATAGNGAARELPITPPSRFGGGPRRVTSRNGTPATAPTAVDSDKIGPDAREEYSTLFEHMLRLNRLREGEPDAPLDRMTLAELHLHYNALLRIVPTEAREPLVESIEILLDELEGRENARGG